MCMFFAKTAHLHAVFHLSVRSVVAPCVRELYLVVRVCAKTLHDKLEVRLFGSTEL